jgi:hypothetical protein
VQTGKHHRAERSVWPANVVVEHVVDAGARGGDRDVDVVLADDGVREIREAAITGIRAAVRRLHNLVAPAAFPCCLRKQRIAEADEPSDHADPPGVHPRDESPQVIDGVRCADATSQRYRRVEADDSALVLQVDLDCVDAMLRDQPEDALSQRLVGPAVRRDVDAPYGRRRPPRLDYDREPFRRGVAGFVGHRERHVSRERRRERRRNATVGVDARQVSVDCDARARFGARVDLERPPAVRPQAFDAKLRRRQVDCEGDTAMRARAEAAALRDLERVLAVGESPRPEDEARPLRADARCDVASVERPLLLLERPVLRADGECQLREACAAD